MRCHPHPRIWPLSQGHRVRFFFFFFFLQCEFLLSFWWIWFMFGMNRRKILKCLERKSAISGELSCLATGFFIRSEDPDQTQRSAASDLVLHCLPKSQKWDARLRYTVNDLKPLCLQRAKEPTDLFKGKTGGLRNLSDEISLWMRSTVCYRMTS